MVRGFMPTPVPEGVAYSPASVAQSVAEGLQGLGHDVTFYGTEKTTLDVERIETCGQRSIVNSQLEFEEFTSSADLFKNYLPSLYDMRLSREMLEAAARGEYDCVIFNHFESALPLAKLFPDVPIVYILHDYIDESRRQMMEMYTSPNQHFISISDNQRRDAPDLNYAATIYNGINTDYFNFEPDAEDYLMFSGRITPIKGVKEAVQVAVQSKSRLLIAGTLSKVDYWYFDEHIKPYLDDRILFLGMLDKEQLRKYYQKAAGLLMPIQWEEPFGLSMVEANACGTPVIAFNRGSVPEIVVNGKNGFVVDNSAEMIMAIKKLKTVSRRSCRDRVVRNYTTARMVKHYETTLLEICHKQAGRVSTAKSASRNTQVRASLKRISSRLKMKNRAHPTKK